MLVVINDGWDIFTISMLRVNTRVQISHNCECGWSVCVGKIGTIVENCNDGASFHQIVEFDTPTPYISNSSCSPKSRCAFNKTELIELDESLDWHPQYLLPEDLV